VRTDRIQEMRDETEHDVTTKKAAMILGVSPTTIHNWVKTGYLQIQPNRLINQNSIQSFLKNIAGKEKLHARANKLQKNSHDHKLLCKKIDENLRAEIAPENLWQEYEHSLSESFRNKEGIFYTPQYVIDDMFKSIDDINLENKTFLDPCCGSGNFIMQAIEKGFNVKNIFGFDTDKNAVAITKKRIFDKTGFVTETIFCEDFLEAAKNTNTQFDYIFTNPPWGKKLSKERKHRFSEMYETGKSNDTSSLFFFACLQKLRESGKLGFLLPESFFNISAFEDARKAALNYSIERLINYEKSFEKILTHAQAIILKNEKPNENFYVTCEKKAHQEKRPQESFRSVPKHIFNFWLDAESNKIIEHIFSLPHTTIAHNAKWGLGIVTGNNKKMCKTICEKNLVPIFRGKDISAKGLKKPSLFIPEDFSRCQQVAPREFYLAKEKLMYRFISKKLIFFCDTKQRYMLNSANMLILHENFPLSGKQLSDLFNSDVMNWLFANIFRTHKILRSDLELLPIHVDYFVAHKVFEEETFLQFLNIEKTNCGMYRIKN
jgi:site-specific DNA-methyltransferase (adenine-specific)